MLWPITLLNIFNISNIALSFTMLKPSPSHQYITLKCYLKNTKRGYLALQVLFNLSFFILHFYLKDLNTSAS